MKVKKVLLVPLSMVLSFAPGCLSTTAVNLNAKTSTTSTTSSTSTAPTVVAGTTRAVKIIFKQNYPAGSFDAPSINGTVAAAGSGHPATRLFNSDGSLMANSPSAATWPAWLKRFEIGVSGSNNVSALNPNCAKFADNAESIAANCNFGGGAIACGAYTGLYRVSEYDCKSASPTVASVGNGGGSDGVYFRVSVDRTQLGTAENLMLVLEYVAAAYNPAPANPSTCFVNGVFVPESCSNVTWKVYLKHNASELVQPFLMLVPPTQNFVTTTALVSSGVNPATKQFFVPLSTDASLSVVQVSRISSNLDVTDPLVGTACNTTAAAAANSPLCAGMILYSLTIYRM